MKTGAEDLVREIKALADLLVVVLAGPDAESAIDGMHQVALEIGAKADVLKEAVKCG
jgi:hypothetical protein